MVDHDEADRVGHDRIAARLRTIIVVDALTALAATVFILVVYVTKVRNHHLLVAAGCVAAAGAVMAAGLRPLGHGDVARALRCLALANWCVAIVAATIATFSWPLMMLTALLPCVAAASVVSRRALAGYVATSVLVSFGVVLVGLLQDFSGLSAEVPTGLRDTVLIVFAPALVGLVALMVLQHSVVMGRALATVNASRAELRAQADELRRSRARLVVATDSERRRIERDLHDGAQQRLIAIGIALSQARDLCRSDPAEAAGVLEALRDELRVAHDELRDLAQGVYPPVLTEHGLVAALQSAADRCALPVAVALQPIGRHPADVEAALYFCAVEALQNAAKHAQASSVMLACGLDGSTLWVSITDDGGGFEEDGRAAGSGIVNLRDRLGAIGGTLGIATRPGGGTVVRADVPVDRGG